MQPILEEFDRRRAQARTGGGTRAASQHAKSKLAAGERVDLLRDEGAFEALDGVIEHRATETGLVVKTVNRKGGGPVAADEAPGRFS